MATLTLRQKQLYEYIKEYIKSRGVSPTFEEIKKHFKLRAISTIHQHIEALINKGFLIKNENLSRGLEIKKGDRLIHIPLAGTIAAGQPIEVIETSEDTITLSENDLGKGGTYYALKVIGNSMIDEGIFDGDTVIIRKQETAENGQTVVAVIDDNEATLKKIYREKDKFRLQPANPSLFPIYRKEVEIRGIVVKITRNLEINKEKKEIETDGELMPETLKYIKETTINHRKSMGQYFTPKSIREKLLEQLPTTVKNPKVLDPACGTGEFLTSAKKYFKNPELYGWDIDQKLVNISKKLFPQINLKTVDALLNNDYNKYDFVIGNPPYYEFTPSVEIKEKFKEIINGRTNIFGLFVYQGIKWLKNGGYLAYVIPPSMNNGAYFAKLRNFIINNSNIEYLHILRDPKLFHGALQSTMLLILKKGKNRGNYIFKNNGISIFSENAKHLEKLFKNKTTLHALGYIVKTGRLVWNQHKDLLTNNPNNTPLIWAHNITTNGLKFPIIDNKKPQYIKYKDFDAGPVIIVNRITGTVKSGKLKAAIIPAGMKFIAENHINVIYPPSTQKLNLDKKNTARTVSLNSIARQLSSKEKVEIVENITGNTQISKTELEKMFPIDIR